MIYITEIYTDGSCLNHGKENAHGGWGFVVVLNDEKVYEKCGKLRPGNQTNNRAELEAVYHAIDYICNEQISDSEYVVYSDSTTCVDGIVGTAVRNANRDIWEDVENLIKYIHENKSIGFDVRYTKRGNKTYNQDADKLARTAANSLLIK